MCVICVNVVDVDVGDVYGVCLCCTMDVMWNVVWGLCLGCMDLSFPIATASDTHRCEHEHMEKSCDICCMSDMVCAYMYIPRYM